MSARELAANPAKWYDGPSPGAAQPAETGRVQPPEASPTVTPPAAEVLDQRSRALSAALDILSFRAVMLLAVLISGGLFAIAAIWPDWIRLASASAFAVAVAAPTVYLYSKPKQ